MRWLEHDSPYGIGMDGQRAAMALALAACIVVAGASTFLLLQDSEVGVSTAVSYTHLTLPTKRIV